VQDVEEKNEGGESQLTGYVIPVEHSLRGRYLKTVGSVPPSYNKLHWTIAVIQQYNATSNDWDRIYISNKYLSL